MIITKNSIQYIFYSNGSNRRARIIELTTGCRHRWAVRNPDPPAPVFQQSICPPGGPRDRFTGLRPFSLPRQCPLLFLPLLYPRSVTFLLYLFFTGAFWLEFCQVPCHERPLTNEYVLTPEVPLSMHWMADPKLHLIPRATSPLGATATANIAPCATDQLSVYNCNTGPLP